MSRDDMRQNDLHSLKDDIDYLRQISEEGRHAPPMFGPVLVAAALIFGAASAGQWALATGLIALSPWAALWLWIVAGLVFAATLALILRRMRHQRGYNSLRNTAVGSAWSAIGFLIFAVWLSLVAMGFSSGDWSAMRVMPSLVFAAYGAAWTIAATMNARPWMNAIALICFGGAVALGLTSGMSEGYLVFALLLGLGALLPGLVLMRQQHRAQAKTA